jgi:hypothetical protein
MKRKVRRRGVEGRPDAPRVEPSSRQLESDIAFEAMPKQGWLRVHPF